MRLGKGIFRIRKEIDVDEEIKNDEVIKKIEFLLDACETAQKSIKVYMISLIWCVKQFHDIGREDISEELMKKMEAEFTKYGLFPKEPTDAKSSQATP